MAGLKFEKIQGMELTGTWLEGEQTDPIVNNQTAIKKN